MGPFNVRSQVCIALINVRSKVYKIALHMDGRNADFAPYMEGRHADFALHIERRHSFKDQTLLKLHFLPNSFKNLFKHLYSRRWKTRRLSSVRLARNYQTHALKSSSKRNNKSKKSNRPLSWHSLYASCYRVQWSPNSNQFLTKTIWKREWKWCPP